MRKRTLGLVLLILGIFLFIEIGAAFLLYALVMGPGGTNVFVVVGIAVNVVFISMIILGLYLAVKGGAEEKREWQRMSSLRCPFCGAAIVPGQSFCSWCGSRLIQPSDVVTKEPGNR